MSIGRQTGSGVPTQGWPVGYTGTSVQGQSRGGKSQAQLDYEKSVAAQNARYDAAERKSDARYARSQAVATAGARAGVAGAHLGQGSARIGAIGANASLHGATAQMLQQAINQRLALMQEQQRQASTIDQTGYGAFQRIVGY